jgi:hypothetical protein
MTPDLAGALCGIRHKCAARIAVSSLPMESTVKHLARTIIVLHGADALRVAEQAAADAQKLGKNLDGWLAVIAEIQRIQTPA